MLKIVSEELKEKYRKCIEKVYANDKEMQKYCMKSYDYLVEISNGQIINLERPKIETNFCFGAGYNGICTEEEWKDANDMVTYADTHKEYFIEENLKQINKYIDWLNEAEKVITIPAYSGRANELSHYRTYRHDWDFENDLYALSNINYSLLSKEDIEKIINGYEIIKADFTKRLNTYLKKYGLSKIRTWSYISD